MMNFYEMIALFWFRSVYCFDQILWLSACQWRYLSHIFVHLKTNNCGERIDFAEVTVLRQRIDFAEMTVLRKRWCLKHQCRARNIGGCDRSRPLRTFCLCEQEIGHAKIPKLQQSYYLKIFRNKLATYVIRSFSTANFQSLNHFYSRFFTYSINFAFDSTDIRATILSLPGKVDRRHLQPFAHSFLLADILLDAFPIIF